MDNGIVFNLPPILKMFDLNQNVRLKFICDNGSYSALSTILNDVINNYVNIGIIIGSYKINKLLVEFIND